MANRKTPRSQRAAATAPSTQTTGTTQSGPTVPLGPAVAATLLLTPLREAVPAEGGALEVLVRVQAPERPPQADGKEHKRIPLRLSLVVDRSGSMSGEPLQEALRCVEHIGSRLQPEDHLAVVMYDDHVQVPIPLTKAPGAQAVALALAGVESGGSTDLFQGWEVGARQLVQGSPSSISRVVLLSDGQANQGHCDPAYLAGQCAQWLDQGVSTTTVGLGRAFNEELMIAMAKAGGGQQYYGQRAEDLYDAFDEELSLLQAMMLRQLRAKPVTAPGVLVEVLGAVKADADGWLPMTDLAWGAESWLLLRLHVTAEPAAKTGLGHRGKVDLKEPGPRLLLAVIVEAQGVDGTDITLHAAPLELPVLPEAECAKLPVDETVQRRLQEVTFADLTLRVRELLQRGKEREAKEMLRRAEKQVANYPWLAAKLEQLKTLTERDAVMASKEMSYNSMKMRSRLVAAHEDMQVADETDSVDKAAYLRRKSSEGVGRRKG